MPDATSQPLEPRFNEPGFSILESHHNRSFEMRESVASYGKLLVPFDGKGDLHIGEPDPIPLWAGRAAWLGPELRHYLEDDSSTPLKLYILCFANRAIQTYATQLAKPEHRVWDQPDWLAEGWDRLREWRLAESMNAQLHGVLGRSLGFWFLSRLILDGVVRPGGHSVIRDSGLDSRERVRQALDELEHTFYLNEPLDHVCRRWGLSRRRFTSLVKEMTGSSWHELRMEFRIQHACRLLRSEPRSLATIAFECGYAEFSTFYRNFKKLTGTTPKNYT